MSIFSPFAKRIKQGIASYTAKDIAFLLFLIAAIFVTGYALVVVLMALTSPLEFKRFNHLNKINIVKTDINPSPPPILSKLRKPSGVVESLTFP